MEKFGFSLRHLSSASGKTSFISSASQMTDLPACFLNRGSPFTMATAGTPSAVHPVSSRSFSFRAFSCLSRSVFAFLIASYSAKIAFASVAVRSTTCSVVLTVVLVVRTVVLTVDVLMVVSFCRFGQTAGWPPVSSQPRSTAWCILQL